MGEVYEPSEHTRRAIGRELTKPLIAASMSWTLEIAPGARVRSAVSLDDVGSTAAEI